MNRGRFSRWGRESCHTNSQHLGAAFHTPKSVPQARLIHAETLRAARLLFPLNRPGSCDREGEGPAAGHRSSRVPTRPQSPYSSSCYYAAPLRLRCACSSVLCFGVKQEESTSAIFVEEEKRNAVR